MAEAYCCDCNSSMYLEPGKEWPDGKIRCNDCAQEFCESIGKLLSVKVGGETIGDTLIRLSRLVDDVNMDEHRTTSEEWSDWIKEIGEKLNSYI